MSAIKLLLFSSLLLTTFVSAQDNQEKYWSFRQTLDDQFLMVGDGQGASIPAAYRNPLFDLIKWADATVDLGWYIGVLASEHHILSNEAIYPGYQNTEYSIDDNIEALYYALKALQRLDLYAETAFILCPDLPSLNGFFIRDDVPAGFHSNFEGMSAVLSDFISINIYDKEMSQDQMYHILLGLSLVSKCVPSSLEYNGENLLELAKALAADIVEHVAIFSNWTIKNPACNKVVYRGPDAWSLSYGTNRAIKQITGSAVQYDDDLVVILNEPVWPGLGNTTNPAHFNSDNTHMIMNLGAIGETWNDATLEKLLNLATLQDFYLYPLLYGVIHDPENIATWDVHAGNLRNRTLDMLDEAPSSGPASPQPIAGTHSWGSNNRFIRKFEDHINGGNGSIGQRYNGLDYMLLYNLHYILFSCPNAVFLPFTGDTICMLKTDIDLVPYGQPAGGIFTGDGVLAGQYFNPSTAGPGSHDLVYTLEGTNGCISSDTLTLLVDVCTYLTEIHTLTDLNIYPNPMKESVTAEYFLEQHSDIQIKLFDAIGKYIKTFFNEFQSPGFHQLQFNTNDLPIGHYQLGFYTSGKGCQISPVIKL